MRELLECPDCGGKSFNWILKQVQRGNIHEFGDGERDAEGMKMGEVLDTDLHENGPWCENCDENYDMDDLVVPDEEY